MTRIAILISGRGSNMQALADRVNDADAKILITSKELYRGNKTVDLKAIVSEALKMCTNLQNLIVLNPEGATEVKHNDFEKDYYKLIENKNNTCPATTMKSEDMLFILYTSGSTGKPKGVVHTCGGYMVYTAYSFQNVFQYEPNDTFGVRLILVGLLVTRISFMAPYYQAQLPFYLKVYQHFQMQDDFGKW